LASGPEGRWPERASGPEGKGRQGGIFKALKYYEISKSLSYGCYPWVGEALAFD
jgi:hypothetical protein